VCTFVRFDHLAEPPVAPWPKKDPLGGGWWGCMVHPIAFHATPAIALPLGGARRCIYGTTNAPVYDNHVNVARGRAT